MTDMRALAKFLYEHCGQNPDQAGDVAAAILSEYQVRPKDARESIARIIAAWIGYSWDGLPDYSTVERGFAEWQASLFYYGGKPDLLRLADALMAHTRPDEVGLRAAAERVCWFDWSDNDMDARAAIDALRKAVAHTRPDERCRYCDEAIEPGHDCSVTRPERCTPSEAK